MPFIGNKPTAVPLTSADIQDGTIGIADLSATGTKDSTTFLRGDNTFNTPSVASLSTASGSAPSYSARAWVNFNGTGTVAIRESGNVSSITDNGAGNYTVNFTTAMPDANYSAIGINDYFGVTTASSYLTTSVSIGTTNHSATGVDCATISVAVFR